MWKVPGKCVCHKLSEYCFFLCYFLFSIDSNFLIAIFLFQAILYDAQTPVFHISMNHLPNLIDSILSFCISIIKFKLQSTQLKHMTHMCFCMRKNWGDFLLLMGVSFYYEKWKLHFKWQ